MSSIEIPRITLSPASATEIAELAILMAGQVFEDEDAKLSIFRAAGILKLLAQRMRSAGFPILSPTTAVCVWTDKAGLQDPFVSMIFPVMKELQQQLTEFAWQGLASPGVPKDDWNQRNGLCRKIAVGVKDVAATVVDCCEIYTAEHEGSELVLKLGRDATVRPIVDGKAAQLLEPEMFAAFAMLLEKQQAGTKVTTDDVRDALGSGWRGMIQRLEKNDPLMDGVFHCPGGKGKGGYRVLTVSEYRASKKQQKTPKRSRS